MASDAASRRGMDSITLCPFKRILICDRVLDRFHPVAVFGVYGPLRLAFRAPTKADSREDYGGLSVGMFASQEQDPFMVGCGASGYVFPRGSDIGWAIYPCPVVPQTVTN